MTGVDHRDFAVVEKDDAPGIIKDRRYVGRDEHFIIAHTDDDPACMPQARGNDAPRLAARHRHHRIAAAQLGKRATHRLFERPGFVVVFAQETGDHLGIRLRCKLMTVRNQALLQFEIVFDDAVLDHDNLA